MMTKQEFCEEIRDNIVDFLPDGIGVVDTQLMTKIDTGDVEKTGLSIHVHGEKVTPIIYLEHFYEEYQDGVGINDICRELVDCRENCKRQIEPSIAGFRIDNYESIKDKLSVKLYDTDKNRRKLEGMVHHCMGDLTATYRVILDDNDSITKAAVVMPEMLECWGVTKRQVHEDALKADAAREPVLSILIESLEYEFTGEEPCNYLDAENQGRDLSGEPILCLSNRALRNGSSLIINPDIQEKIARLVGGDYYVLPSSVEEVMIVPAMDHKFGDAISLSEMVKEINAVYVQSRDWLSDTVQYYDSDRKKLINAVAYEKKELSISEPKALAI